MLGAGRHDEVEEDCIAFGIDPDAFAAGDEPRFALLEESVPVVSAFLTVQSQLTESGFDYAGVRAGLAMARIRVTPELFEGLRVMEAAALAAWRERHG